MAEKRSVKVYGQSGYKYRETPMIMLKGLWLKEAGFDIGGLYLRHLRRWQDLSRFSTDEVYAIEHKQSMIEHSFFSMLL